MTRSLPDAQTVRGLRAIQRRMAGVIFRPLTDDQRTQPRWTDGRRMSSVAEEFIKPNDRLTSVERLEIYNRQYWFRLLDILYDDYPGLRAVLGVERFMSLCQAYLAEYPSRSFSLRNLSSRLVPFLEAHPSFARPRQRLVLDMARFEWAQNIAFDEAALPPLTTADLQGRNPQTLRVRLQPHITLLELAYPLDEFLIAVKRLERSVEAAANAADASDGAAHKAVAKKVKPPRARRTFLAVHRYDTTLYYKKLEPEAFAVLRLLHAGRPLGPAVARALAGVGPDKADWPATTRGWFEGWMSMGWFCKANI